MPSIITNQQVFTPRSLTEALQFLVDHRAERWRPVAGGTSVMWQLHHHHADTTRWINLAPLRAELAGIHDDGNGIRIGALATMTELCRSAVLHEACPLIRQAATSVGGVQLQNRATVGGRIISNSPAGETLPLWLALDAGIELTSHDATRCVPYQQFMTGHRQTAIEPDELLTAVRFPVPEYSNRRLLFRKVAARSAGAIGKVMVAAIANLDAEGRYRNVRLAFGGMGPLPLRALAAEQRVDGNRASDSLGEQAANALALDLTPIDDHRSTADYRMRVARNLTRAFVAGHIGQTTTESGHD